MGNNRIVDIEDNAINGGQLINGQKPERVVFILLENQHCNAAAAAPSGPGSIVEGPPVPASQQRQQQAPLDACASAPKVNDPHFDSACYNGGACKSLASSSNLNSSNQLNYACACPAGFTGPLCELNTDDCVDHQCQNGALCVDGVNSYKCICRDPTTSGEFCEQLAPSGANSAASLGLAYAAGSAAAALSTLPLVAPPLALPIISSGNSPANELTHAQQQQPPSSSSSSSSLGQAGQQILARSADFPRLHSSAADQQQQQQQVAPDSGDQLLASEGSKSSESGGGGGGGCQRLTQRKYFDDGNGCQSVRLLKLSVCAGTCSPATGQACCQPARVKRRRVRMQCSDGASYVKTIDLIKKCSCSSDSATAVCPSSQLQQQLFGPNEMASDLQAPGKQAADSASKSSQYFKYLSSAPAAAPQAAAAAPASTVAAAASNQQHKTGFSNQQQQHFSDGIGSGAQEADQMMQITRLDAVD